MDSDGKTPKLSEEELQTQAMFDVLKHIMPEDHPDGPRQKIEHLLNDKDRTLLQISFIRNGAKGKYKDDDTYPSDQKLLKEVQKYHPNAKYEPTRGKDGVSRTIDTHDNDNKHFLVTFGHKNREWHFCATLEGFKSGFMPHVSWPS